MRTARAELAAHALFTRLLGWGAPLSSLDVSGVDRGNTRRSRRLEPSSDVVGQRLDDVFVLVHLETNRIHELNRTGARFWELLLQDGDVEQIVHCMVHEFDVSEHELSKEVDQLVAELEAEGLVTSVAGA